jgi:hypothetical protein
LLDRMRRFQWGGYAVGIGSTDNKVRVDLHLHSRALGSATNVWVKGPGDENGARVVCAG